MKRSSFFLLVSIVAILAIISSCSKSNYSAERTGRGGPPERAGEYQDPRYEQESKGRPEPILKSPVVIDEYKGILAYDDPEWYLETENGSILLHLGNRSFLESLDIKLEEGADVIVFGITEDDGIAVVRLSLEDGEIALRDESGMPLWAGRGNDNRSQSDENRQPEERQRGPGQGRGGKGGGGEGRGRQS